MDVLQGTDGVRGKINYERTDNPIGLFLKNEVITPQFIEQYIYGSSLALINSGIVQKDGGAILSFDGRDESGLLTISAIKGIIRAGLRPVLISDFTGGVPTLGKCLPTPAVPLYMAYIGSTVGFMLTASHNPYNQNGVKIFLTPLGVKPLLRDDAILSSAVLSVDKKDLESEIDIVFEEDYENASDVFVKFHLDRNNSWLDKGLSGLRLIIDPANGALTHIASKILSSIDGLKVREVIGKEPYRINDDCGVVELEGNDFISFEDIHKRGGKYSDNRPLQALLEEAEKDKEIFRAGKEILLLVSFDGDGDRVMILLFDPFNEGFIVLSGDETAVMQAEYLKNNNIFPEGGLFVNTIESDINVLARAKGLEYETKFVGVGDRWLLREVSSKVLEHLGVSNIGLYDDGGSIIETMGGLKRGDIISKGDMPFFGYSIGSEESGHTVSQGILEVEEGVIPVFAGDGVKTCLNTLAYIHRTFIEKPTEEFYKIMREPFVRGYKENRTCFFSNRYLFYRNSDVFNRIRKLAMKFIDSISGQPGNISIVEKVMPEAKDMLYLKFVIDEKECYLYIRNSGTEDKTAVYVRGDKEVEAKLTRVLDTIFKELITLLKNKDNPEMKIEVYLLKLIESGYVDTTELVSELEIIYPGRNIRGLVSIVRKKEGAVILTDKGLKLTGIGREILRKYGNVL
jgi:phosphomannomutase